MRDISAEEPLLINPYLVDPQTLLGFREWTIVAKSDSHEAMASIEFYGLDSIELDEARRDRFYEIQQILSTLEQLVDDNIHKDSIIDAVEFLKNALSPEFKFSAMISDNFKRRIDIIVEYCS